MKKLYLLSGISGSGKTSWLENNNIDLKYIVSSDRIRKELTGDINNMTREKNVWNLVATRLQSKLSEFEIAYLDATTLSYKSFKSIAKPLVNQFCDDLKIELICFLPELNLSLKRIYNDIALLKDRSRVPIHIVVKQAKNMYNFYKKIYDTDILSQYGDVNIQYVSSTTGDNTSVTDGKLYMERYSNSDYDYTAYVLTDESSEHLKEYIKNSELKYVFNFSDFEFICHHSTLYLGGILKCHKSHLDNEIKLKITKVGHYAGKVIAVQVEGNSLTENLHPHITVALSKSKNGKPNMSNEITTWLDFENPIYVNCKLKQVKDGK